MEAILDDRFAVFVRELLVAGRPPRLPTERQLTTCSTYEQARAVCRECNGPTRQCVIRFVGPAGGGD
jgi:hypothetical protein